MTSKGVHSDPTRPGHSAPAPFGRSLRKLVAGSVSALLFAAAAPAFADEPPAAAKDPEAAKVQAFADALKAKDPEAHKRFVTLHEAKDKGLADQIDWVMFPAYVQTRAKDWHSTIISRILSERSSSS